MSYKFPDKSNKFIQNNRKEKFNKTYKFNFGMELKGDVKRFKFDFSGIWSIVQISGYIIQIYTK